MLEKQIEELQKYILEEIDFKTLSIDELSSYYNILSKIKSDKYFDEIKEKGFLSMGFANLKDETPTLPKEEKGE